MPEKVRVEGMCSICDSSLHVMLMNEHNELVALECTICNKRTGLNIPWVLTLGEADYLGQLIKGVQRGCKLRYYRNGSESADNPVMLVLRSFTYEGGGLYSHEEDIREAYVWCSGITERWFKVNDILIAMDNFINGNHGVDNPMAYVEKE